MPKYCPKCGAEILGETKFCINCGNQLQAKASAHPQEPTPPQEISQQIYPPNKSKKLNIKIICVLIAIVAVIIAIVVIFVLFTGDGIVTKQFIGTWDAKITGGIGDMQWTFYIDRTLEIINYEYGSPSTISTTWRIENNKLYIGETSGIDIPIDTGMIYEFSDGGNKITLSYSYIGTKIPVYTLTKIS